MEPLDLRDRNELARRLLRRIRRAWLGLAPKQFNEREFWREEILQIEAWYDGRRSDLYGCAPPRDAQKVRAASKRDAALMTWFRVFVLSQSGYIAHLMVPPDYFRGCKIADIGCGPMGAPLAFTNCEIWGIDPLADLYRGLGYPVDRYDARMKYVSAGAESIPVADGYFDAVISNNAIDHVDDFAAVAREIRRVLKPGGIVRMEVHYHSPTSCEPWALNDQILLEHFGGLGVRKLMERALTDAYVGSTKLGESVSVWGNTPELYRAAV